eukprot:TRINITY_DN9025_c0_g1_i1.p2 TRINITY_DN9025_c0_g1~~TRINITY_DN9025_c0_g1_i1.p2  ORF type:complete len:568 (-),score=124.46 TRINITY_DN9025_c0_g1_i1:2262-3965(-)
MLAVAQTKALLFEQELRKSIQELRDREIKVGPVVGYDLMSDAKRQAIIFARENLEDMQAAERRAIDRDRLTTQAEMSRVAHPKPEPLHPPPIDSAAADALPARRLALDRFRWAGYKIVYRLRGEKRLRAIQERLHSSAYDAAQVAALTATQTQVMRADMRTAATMATQITMRTGRTSLGTSGVNSRGPATAGSMGRTITGDGLTAPPTAGQERDAHLLDALRETQGGSPEEHDLSAMSLGTVQLAAFPTYDDAIFRTRKPVYLSKVDLPDDWPMLKLRVPVQYKMLGYQKQPLPPPGTYPPDVAKVQPRVGAQEESFVMVPRGIDVLQQEHAPPASCFGPLAFAPIEYIHPEPTIVAHVPLPPWRESDTAFALRARIRDEPLPKSKVQRLVSNILLAPSLEPIPSDVWMPRRELTLLQAPAPLTGPQQEDDMSDDEDEDVTAAARPAPPTADAVAAAFPVPSKSAELSAGTTPFATEWQRAMSETETRSVTLRKEWAQRLPHRLDAVNATIAAPQLKLASLYSTGAGTGGLLSSRGPPSVRRLPTTDTKPDSKPGTAQGTRRTISRK